MKVKFIDVGRNKACWASECKELTYNWLYKQAKKVLRSSVIDFEENGTILVGGFRPVGRFEIE